MKKRINKLLLGFTAAFMLVLSVGVPAATGGVL